MIMTDVNQQRTEWKRKGWSIPELRGGKQNWFQIVVELLQLIATNSISDLSTAPILHVEYTSYPWRMYIPFLKGIGLVKNRSGILNLSDIGLELSQKPSKTVLAQLLHSNYRLFGEILTYLVDTPKSLEEVNKELCRDYSLDWLNLSNTRRRMDWLEILEMIEAAGNRKWRLTNEGKKAYNEWKMVTPDVLGADENDEKEVDISEPPSEICDLINKLKTDPSLHYKRNTYNIWVPSPNRIENLRTIIQFSTEKVSRTELFRFIEDEFSIKTSSVESMMPFLKADGLLEEVGRNIYVATAAAKAWCDSGDDLNFIRIIHTHKRFVGEIIAYSKNVVTRNDIYSLAKEYGINHEKARWIIGFLIEAGLLEETQYLHLKATRLGRKFVLELPLMEPPQKEKPHDLLDKEHNAEENTNAQKQYINTLFEKLIESARDPMAGSKASGVCFEESIAELFSYMGFDAKRIGGSGNTDVVVRWKDEDGKTITAIVDAKSKSNSSVTHDDISDVAIETHKEKNDAEFVAIIGPGFAGDTIKNHARKKGFALIKDTDLVEIAKNQQIVGLSLAEIATLFNVPNGLSQLNELISTRKREQEIIALVIATFKQEQDTMESLSARDLYFLLRRTDISPSLEELINAFETLSKEEIGVLKQIKKASATENITYAIQDEKYCINKLRALANSIENGLCESID